MTIETLTKIGGSEWQKGAMHRVYFNDLATRYGLTVHRYKTGNISSASLNGARVSNTKARALLTTLDLGKLWWDVPTGTFQTQNLPEEIAATLIASITADL